jgi:hypothetical protein
VKDGCHNVLKQLDSILRGNDIKATIQAYYNTIHAVQIKPAPWPIMRRIAQRAGLLQNLPNKRYQIFIVRCGTPAMKVYPKIGCFYRKPVGWVEERNPTQ